MPPPWLGVQFVPSLSVKAVRLSCPVNCETNVRPVMWSVNRMGSSDTVDVVAKLTSSQVAFAGEVQSSKLILEVRNDPVNITLSVFQLHPMDGSSLPGDCSVVT